MFSKRVLSLPLAAIALAASLGQALAVPAAATGNVNVRSGPGTSYSVVDQLRPGQWVDVDHCRGSWCFVRKAGPHGWVSANYLAPAGEEIVPPRFDPIPIPPPVYIPPRYAPPPVYVPPPPPPVYWGGWQGHPQWDQPRPWPPRHPQPNSVCVGGPLGQFCVTD